MRNGELEFEKIHEAFRPKILRYLTRLVGPYEAEDLTQEVFVRVNRPRSQLGEAGTTDEDESGVVKICIRSPDFPEHCM